MCIGISREKARLKFMYILIATDTIKTFIFKGSSLKNVTNTTKKRYWDRFVTFLKNCYHISKFLKRRESFLP